LEGQGVVVGDEGLKALSGLRKLEELTITNEGQVRDQSLHVLRTLTHLRRLELRGFPRLTGRALAGVWELRGLRSLQLDLCIRCVGDVMCGGDVPMNDIEQLSLGTAVRTLMPDEAINKLAGFKKLRYLDLGKCDGYTDHALASVIRALPDLQVLKRTYWCASNSR
jgi:hypothetical protein